jgi:hypothetical protein
MEKGSKRKKEKERDEMFSFIRAWSSDRITKKIVNDSFLLLVSGVFR